MKGNFNVVLNVSVLRALMGIWLDSMFCHSQFIKTEGPVKLWMEFPL